MTLVPAPLSSAHPGRPLVAMAPCRCCRFPLAVDLRDGEPTDAVDFFCRDCGELWTEEINEARRRQEEE